MFFNKNSTKESLKSYLLEKFYGDIGYAYYDFDSGDYSFESKPIIDTSEEICGFKDTFVFDPFYIEYENQKLLFYELCGVEKNIYSCVIACSVINDKGDITDTKIMLRPKNSGKKPDAADYTISYPFPIIANEKLYFVCEEYHSGSTNLYFYDDKNLNGFKFIKRLWSGIRDPNIEYSDGVYWIYGVDKDYTLIVLVSDKIEGTYHEHFSSKKYQGKKFARNAGMPFEVEGKKIRPFQNCKNVYGEKVNFSQYELTLKNGFELIDNSTNIKEIKGNPRNPKWIRTKSHHFCPIEITSHGIKAIIDGGRKRYIYDHGWEKIEFDEQ